MILWKDFILDDVMGPLLLIPELPLDAPIAVIERAQRCRREGALRLSVMEDAKHPSLLSDGTSVPQGADIQETSRKQRPARMVGHSGDRLSHIGMEAEQPGRTQELLDRHQPTGPGPVGSTRKGGG